MNLMEQVPGVLSTPSTLAGFEAYRFVALESRRAVFVFNDGAESWDNNGGSNYTIGMRP